ncbi:hypothetical protein I317_01003 [Kwoniella heveanensis CBS 569]|nr:hypothetical protein I317_01003 [Kwoniella heveanensis CBS 569]
MPAAKQSNHGHDFKPYARTTTTDNQNTTPKQKNDAEPNFPSSPSKRAGVAGRKWTSEELLQLFEHVLKNGPRNWDGVVEGRTGNQCMQTWSKTLLPFLKNSIIAKGS